MAFAIGDRVYYKGKKRTIAENRGKGYTLQAKDNNTPMELNVPASKLKAVPIKQTLYESGKKPKIIFGRW